jgi:hypothetical protein
MPLVGSFSLALFISIVRHAQVQPVQPGPLEKTLRVAVVVQGNSTPFDWDQQVASMIANANRLMSGAGCRSRNCGVRFQIGKPIVANGLTPSTYSELLTLRTKLGNPDVVLLDGFHDYYTDRPTGKPFCGKSDLGCAFNRSNFVVINRVYGGYLDGSTLVHEWAHLGGMDHACKDPATEVACCSLAGAAKCWNLRCVSGAQPNFGYHLDGTICATLRATVRL